jgi:MoxR-like ATPase
MTQGPTSVGAFVLPTDQESYKHHYLALGVAIKANVPVILWGAPGQGKTSVIKNFADKSGRKLEIILASIREPQDFIGLPALVDGEMRFMPPEWAKRLASESNGGILFADEVNTAPPSVQAALLRVCLEKVAGDFDLGKPARNCSRRVGSCATSGKPILPP